VSASWIEDVHTAQMTALGILASLQLDAEDVLNVQLRTGVSSSRGAHELVVQLRGHDPSTTVAQLRAVSEALGWPIEGRAVSVAPGRVHLAVDGPLAGMQVTVVVVVDAECVPEDIPVTPAGGAS